VTASGVKIITELLTIFIENRWLFPLLIKLEKPWHDEWLIP